MNFDITVNKIRFFILIAFFRKYYKNDNGNLYLLLSLFKALIKACSISMIQLFFFSVIIKTLFYFYIEKSLVRRKEKNRELYIM